MTPNTYRAQCRRIRELLASRERPQGLELAHRLLASFRAYRFHLGDMATGVISADTRAQVLGTLISAGYAMNAILHVTAAERALLDARAKLHTAK